MKHARATFLVRNTWLATLWPSRPDPGLGLWWPHWTVYQNPKITAVCELREGSPRPPPWLSLPLLLLCVSLGSTWWLKKVFPLVTMLDLQDTSQGPLRACVALTFFFFFISARTGFMDFKGEFQEDHQSSFTSLSLPAQQLLFPSPLSLSVFAKSSF